MTWESNFNKAGLPRKGSFRSIMGYANESLAIGRALQCGFNLFFKAWRDSAYDAVLDYNGILFRVEIKGTQTNTLGVTSGGRAGRQINREAGSREHVLQKEDADFLFGIKGQKGDSYIIPIEVIQIINQKTIALSKLEGYKEKWGIFVGTNDFPPKVIREGFLDKTVDELNDICTTHNVTIITKLTRSSTPLSIKNSLVISIWNHIYDNV